MSLQEQGGEPQTQCACPHGSTCAVRDAAGSKGRSCRGVGGVTVCGQDPQPPSVAHRAAARSARMPLGTERRAAGWRPHRVLAAALAARCPGGLLGEAKVVRSRWIACVARGAAAVAVAARFPLARSRLAGAQRCAYMRACAHPSRTAPCIGSVPLRSRPRDGPVTCLLSIGNA